MPIKAAMIIVQQPIKRENNILNICTEIYGDDLDDDDIDDQVTVNSVISESVSSSSNKYTNEPVSKQFNESLLDALNV